MVKIKAQAEPLKVIVVAFLLIIVAFIVIFVFRNLFGKEVDVTKEQIDKLGDYDLDGAVNMFDKCPCDPSNSCICETNPENIEGCKKEKVDCENRIKEEEKKKK